MVAQIQVDGDVHNDTGQLHTSLSRLCRGISADTCHSPMQGHLVISNNFLLLVTACCFSVNFRLNVASF